MDLAYKQEATVGTLVILAFVLFFVGTTWLSGRSIGTDSDDFYKIEFRDASNLKASSVVRISGVPVGKVEKISLAEVGKRHYPFLPVDWMLKHRFDSAALAPKIKTPLLCIVASHDEIIPAEHAKRLYDAWGGPKLWVGLEGAGHNSTDNAANYWPSIQRFLTEKPT